MSETTTPLVHRHDDGAVATLTLDSPHNRNALSAQLVRELRGHLQELHDHGADAGTRVVVLQAEGHVFCSGADLSEASSGDAPADGQGPEAIVDLQRQIVAHALPVVTRLHGAVRAGGIGLVAASDVVVAAEDATFALTEVKLALTPAVISLTVLPRMTDRAAAWAFLTGEKFDGRTAAEMGLVTRAVPAAELDDAVAQVTASLASGAPQGLRETKALLAGDLLDRIDARREEMVALSARLFDSEAAHEAMTAFLERRS